MDPILYLFVPGLILVVLGAVTVLAVKGDPKGEANFVGLFTLKGVVPGVMLAALGVFLIYLPTNKLIDDEIQKDRLPLTITDVALTT